MSKNNIIKNEIGLNFEINKNINKSLMNNAIISNSNSNIAIDTFTNVNNDELAIKCMHNKLLINNLFIFLSFILHNY